jgi:hypothetical protein
MLSKQSVMVILRTPILPASANEVKPSTEAIAKLHRRAILPVFTEEQGMEIQAEQACFLPIAERGCRRDIPIRAESRIGQRGLSVSRRSITT